MSAFDFIARAVAMRAAAQIPAAIAEVTAASVRTGASPLDFEAMVAAMNASRSGPLAGPGTYLTEFETGYSIEPGYYEGIGPLTTPSGKFHMVARVPGTVVIRIPDGAYFLEMANAIVGVHFEGIVFVGGKGAFRATHTGINVQGKHTFRNCIFYDYSECAIQNSASDHPFLQIENCFFFGKAGERTIGVAWGGLLDGAVISGSQFARNAIHLKLGGGTSNISGSFTIESSSFLSFGGTSTEADIWFVPCHKLGGFGVSSGAGGLVTHNKFGNEGQALGSPRILIAAESIADVAAGKVRGAIFPELAWEPSTGGYTDILSGLIFAENRISSLNAPNAPFIRSYVREVRECTWAASNKFDGGQYTYLVEFMGQRSPRYTNQNWDVTITPAGSAGTKKFPFSLGVSNHPIGDVQDPAVLAGTLPLVLPCAPVQADHGYELYKDLRLPSDWLDSGTTATSSADLYGAAAAQDIAFSSATALRYANLPACSRPRLAWVQLLGLEKAAALGADKVRVFLYNYQSQARLDEKDIILPPNGQPCSQAYHFTSPGDGSTAWRIALQLPGAMFEAGARTTIRFQGAYLNYGPRPAPLGHQRVIGGNWDQPHIVMDQTHLWRTSASQLRMKDGAPTFELDGVPAGIGTLAGFASDAAAAAGGVPVGSLYRNGSAVMVRVS